MIVLPFFAMAGLLLLLFCWRDLLTWAWPGVLLGIIVGALPLIKYDIQAGNGQNPWSTLMRLIHGTSTQAPHTLFEIAVAVKNTILVSIPTATGNPFCPVIEIPSLGDNAPHIIQCTLIHASWGLGYLALLGIALFFTFSQLWRVRPRRSTETTDQRQSLIRYMAQLLLLGASVLAIATYSVSEGPVGWPGFHARYLITLLIATPAMIAPLWSAASTVKTQMTQLERVKVITSRSIMVLVLFIFLVGTWIAFSEVPAAQASTQQRASLINNLVHIGATHIYTDYWTCNNLAFQSNEKIICGVIDGNLNPNHNRAPHYYEIVDADPRAAYVFPTGQMPAVLQKIQQLIHLYQIYVFDGYTIYQPT